MDGSIEIKLLHEVVHVLGNAILVVHQRQASGEARGGRLVHPNHVRVARPAVGVPTANVQKSLQLS